MIVFNPHPPVREGLLPRGAIRVAAWGNFGTPMLRTLQWGLSLEKPNRSRHIGTAGGSVSLTWGS